MTLAVWKLLLYNLSCPVWAQAEHNHWFHPPTTHHQERFKALQAKWEGTILWAGLSYAMGSCPEFIRFGDNCHPLKVMYISAATDPILPKYK